MDTYRRGFPIIRFTLHAEDFTPWREIPRRFPAWTPEQVRRLETNRKGRICSPALWWCRAEPLPRERWIEVAAKTYHDNTWRTLPYKIEGVQYGPNILGITINRKNFYSLCNPGRPGRATTYLVGMLEDARHLIEGVP
jgi:hypothetical protein